jgi:uncharacterized protein (UPF0371 family)
MMERIMGKSPYKSPTDMGVNMAGYCIFDDEAVNNASKQEILRRFYAACCGVRQGTSEKSEVAKLELLMGQAGITTADRPVVKAALDKAEKTGAPAVALQFDDGRIITGKTSSLLGSSAAVLLNALKELAGIDDDINVISHVIIEPIQKLKTGYMGNHNPRLHTDEVLIALAISAVNNPMAQKAMDAIPALKYAEVHSTVILSQVDAQTFRKLGMGLTCEPKYQTKKLFHR